MNQHINLNLSLKEETDDEISTINEEQNLEKIILNVFNLKTNIKSNELKKGRRKKNVKLNIPGHLKEERDNQLKTIKVYFHRFIIKFLNKELEKLKIKKKFYRFVKIFQEAICIKINQKLLQMPLSEILMKVNAYKKVGNRNLLLYNDLKDNIYLKKYFDMTYQELYEKFMKSEDLQLLIKNKGIKIKKTINNFISYYQNKKPKIILDENMQKFYIKLFGNENE